MSSFGSLSIGISGLLANRRALETVSHNISNADNMAYSRQRVNTIDSPYSQIGMQTKGTGVSISGISQIRDEFVDKKIRGEISNYGYWGERYSIFNQVESILNEQGQINDKAPGGLGKTLDDFWKSWEEVLKTPESLTARGVLRERTEGFISVVRQMDRQLEDLQKNLNTKVINLVDETNKISKEIAELNKIIVLAEASGQNANDYKDERNELIDRLSEILDISTSEDSRGYVNVSIAGRHLVMEGSVKELDYETDSTGGFLVNVKWKGGENPLELGKDIKAGQLMAILEARGSGTGVGSEEYAFSEIVPAMRQELNKLVNTIANAINEIHREGYTLDGSTGIELFASEGIDSNGDPLPITAGNIILNIKSLNDIAASQDQDSIGNSKNAEAILNLREKLIYESSVNSRKMNIDEFYSEVISGFGLEGKEAYILTESHGRIIIELDNKKRSISGVSLDEEMSNMLKFQHSYNASTRFINAIDEMLDVIINRMAM